MLSTSRMTPTHLPLPLSPLSANIHVPRHDIFMSSHPQQPQHNALQDQENQPSIAFSKRSIKKAPSPRQDELQTKRREKFLSNVKAKREEKRFETRGDDMMRAQFLREQRDWEARLASQAPEFPYMEEEEPEEGREDWTGLPESSGGDGSMFGGSQMPRPERLVEAEVEEVERMEEAELEALLAYLPDREMGAEEHPWSDDDDYDALFSQLVAQQTQPRTDADDVGASGDAMDLS